MPIRPPHPARARVAVVGGSLGGLTTALLLRDLGCDVEVFERSELPLTGFGAGIVVHEATMRYLRRRRGNNATALEVPATFFRYLDRAGDVVYEARSPYTFTAWSALYTTLLELFDDDRYHRGHTLTHFEQQADGVSATFANGRSMTADLLVCADGILSTARGQIAPGTEPRYAGYVGWRGTVEEERLSQRSAQLLSDAITYAVVDHSHILAYPIPPLDDDAGGRLLNFVWYRNIPEPELGELMIDRNGQPRQISLHPGAVQDRHVDELRAAAHADLPAAFAEMVAAAGTPFVQVIVDVAVDAMVSGRACLLGDAAFAARPHAAAGTAKAAENAWKLADALAAADSVTEALSRWEPEQLRLGRQLVQRSRQIGEQYQVAGGTRPEDENLRFGLYGPGR